MPNFSELKFLMMLMRILEDSSPIRTTVLSRKIGIKPPSVVEYLQRLEHRRMVKRLKWKETLLTVKGKRVAKSLLHNHRVLEIYFVTFLNLDEETACKEASKIDFCVGQKTINAMCKLLNYPRRCFHEKEVYHENCM